MILQAARPIVTTIGKAPEGADVTRLTGFAATEKFEVASTCPQTAQAALINTDLAAELEGGHGARKVAKDMILSSDKPIQFVFGVQ